MTVKTAERSLPYFVGWASELRCDAAREHYACPLGSLHGPAAAEVCRWMAEQIPQVAQVAGGPSLVCCAMGGKVLLLPVHGQRGQLVDAAVLRTRSPVEDPLHLHQAAEYYGLDRGAVMAAWRALPPFCEGYAVQALGEVRSRLPAGAALRDETVSQLLSLARAYGSTGRPTLYEMDVRIYTAVASLRSLAAVKSIQVLYFVNTTYGPVLRLFHRDLGAFFPVEAPIIGFASSAAAGQALDGYLARFSDAACGVREERAAEDTLLGRFLPVLADGKQNGTYVSTMRVLPPVGWTRQDGDWVAGADVHLTHHSPARAEIAGACLNAASDWGEARALGELLARIPPANPGKWDAFNALLLQFAAALPPAGSASDKTQGEWSRALYGMYALLHSQPYASARDGLSPAIRSALGQLGECVGRRLLDTRTVDALLEETRSAVLGMRPS